MFHSFLALFVISRFFLQDFPFVFNLFTLWRPQPKYTLSLIMYLCLFDILDDLLLFYRLKFLDDLMLSFHFYGCWLVTFRLHNLFPIFDSMIPLIIICFFSVEFIFSIFRGCWRWDNPHPLGDWKDVFFYVFSFFVPFCFVFHVWWRYKPHPPWSDRCKNCGAATNTFSRLQIVFLPDWTENAFRQKLFGIKKMWSISVQNDNN